MSFFNYVHLHRIKIGIVDLFPCDQKLNGIPISHLVLNSVVFTIFPRHIREGYIIPIINLRYRDFTTFNSDANVLFCHCTCLLGLGKMFVAPIRRRMAFEINSKEEEE